MKLICSTQEKRMERISVHVKEGAEVRREKKDWLSYMEEDILRTVLFDML